MPENFLIKLACLNMFYWMRPAVLPGFRLVLWREELWMRKINRMATSADNPSKYIFYCHILLHTTQVRKPNTNQQRATDSSITRCQSLSNVIFQDACWSSKQSTSHLSVRNMWPQLTGKMVTRVTRDLVHGWPQACLAGNRSPAFLVLHSGPWKAFVPPSPLHFMSSFYLIFNRNISSNKLSIYWIT